MVGITSTMGFHAGSRYDATVANESGRAVVVKGRDAKYMHDLRFCAVITGFQALPS
jgi:hypothetical protein